MDKIVPHEVFLKSFYKSQFPHKSVNLYFISVIINDKLMDLWGRWLLQNDVKNNLCEIRGGGPEVDHAGFAEYCVVVHLVWNLLPGRQGSFDCL